MLVHNRIMTIHRIARGVLWLVHYDFVVSALWQQRSNGIYYTLVYTWYFTCLCYVILLYSPTKIWSWQDMYFLPINASIRIQATKWIGKNNCIGWGELHQERVPILLSRNMQWTNTNMPTIRVCTCNNCTLSEGWSWMRWIEHDPVPGMGI